LENQFTEHFLIGRLDTDIRLHYCGLEHCMPSHQNGPVMRDHYLLHFIVKGSGVFTMEGCDYKLKAGDSFCMYPNQPASYRASETDPWTYYWVGIDGQLAAKLFHSAGVTVQSPTHSHIEPERAEKLLAELLDLSAVNDLASETYCYGLMLQIFSTFLSRQTELQQPVRSGGRNSNELYVAQAVKFIEEHYHKRISISVIARHVDLDRSYFTKLFHSQMGVSPHEFLIRYRMEKACLMLSQTSLPVQLIASSVGFEDAAYFGKAFIRRLGLSPTAFRKRGTSLQSSE
jgi:AraC-like DNA-binding protein